MMCKHKKGMDGPSTLGKFIIVFLLVFVLIILFNKVLKGNTQVMRCDTNGGRCTPGTCDWGKEIPAMGDKTAGCEEKEVCCIPVTKEDSVPDPECEGKVLGDACGTGATLALRQLKTCDKASKCVSLCEFCSTNADTQTQNAIIRSMCDKVNGNIENFTKNKGKYSCSCSSTECSPKLNDGTCMINYCPTSTDPNAYRCCFK
jgi:hypothetical protein